MNLASIIDPHPADRAALISRRRRTTYGELRDQVSAMRGGLARLGLEPGDRVGIACANNWYFVASYLAVLGAGLVAVPLNPQSPPEELGRELGTVQARALLAGPATQASAAALDRVRLAELGHVLAPDELLGGQPSPLVDRADDDLAVLVFTSGTAGAPRAAMLTHGNLRANLDQTQATEARRQRSDDVSLAVLPLYHIFGLNVVLGLSLRAGSAVLLIERFDPASALEAVRDLGVTVIAGVPTMWAAWAALPDADPTALSGVRIATSGAARLTEDTVERIRTRFGLELAEGYGLTEASPVVTSALGRPARTGSIGGPLAGVEVRLVDADGGDVLVGDAGEIWVRGPNVFAGYWDDAEATRTVLTDDGWLRTGDVAVVDDDGFLFLVDRAKDLIIVSGFNVFPAEVEEVLLAHPAVADAAVVGVSHPHSGEAVKAYVVPVDGRSVEEDDVISYTATRLARYKCPDKVMFVDEIPHNLAGKIVRRALR